jgi:hypothetical protein
VEKSISGVGVRVAVGGGNGVPVGRGTGVEVAGRAVGASGVRVGRERKAAAREVGVTEAAGAQAFNKNTRQERRINSERSLFLIMVIPII